ncbi:transposase, partial [Leptospira kirschneri serovar Pomona]
MEKKRKILYSEAPDRILNQTFSKKEFNMDLTEIFCAIDDYCTQQKINWNVKILSPVVRKRNRKFQLSLSEVATIVVYFHLSHYREFK